MELTIDRKENDISENITIEISKYNKPFNLINNLVQTKVKKLNMSGLLPPRALRRVANLLMFTLSLVPLFKWSILFVLLVHSLYCLECYHNHFQS